MNESYWWCWNTGWGMRGRRGRRRHNCMICPTQGAPNGPLNLSSPFHHSISSVFAMTTASQLWNQNFPHKACFAYLCKSIWADFVKTRSFCRVTSLHVFSRPLWQSVSAYAYFLRVNSPGNGLMVFRYCTWTSLRIVHYKRNNSTLPFQNSQVDLTEL